MKLHHIGIATRNMEETAKLLEKFGYCGGEKELDPEQNVYVKFLHHDSNPDLELIGGGKWRVAAQPDIGKKRDVRLPPVL